MYRMKELIFNLSIEEYNKLLHIVTELNKVSDVHKIKWLKDKILFYSILAEKDSKKVNAVKAFIIDRTELFSAIPSDTELTYNISSGKEWLKKFKFIAEENETVEVALTYKEDNKSVYTFRAKNSILEISNISAEDSEIKDMPMTFIKNNMNPNIADWSIPIGLEILNKTKKISKLDTSDLLTIKISSGVVSLTDNSWELKIGIVEGVSDNKIFVNKKFLSMMTLSEGMSICVFPTYILVKEDQSVLLYNQSMFA
jgi:hypothetical protein